MGEPRGHHYVTKAYLKGFLEPDQKHLFCYGRESGSQFKAQPEKLAKIRDFHSYIRADGSLDTSLETLIERDVETPGLVVLKSLQSGQRNLDQSQRRSLASLVALQIVRTPYERDSMDQHMKESLLEYLYEMDSISLRSGSPVNAMEIATSRTDRIPREREWLAISRAEVQEKLSQIDREPRRFSRETFFQFSKVIAGVLAKMHWTLCFGPVEERFITSDCPVVTLLTTREGVARGILDLNSRLMFPLSSCALLRMDHGGNILHELREKRLSKRRKSHKADVSQVALASLSKTEVRSLNELQADRAKLWTFSGRDEPWLLQRLKSYSRRSRQSRVVSNTEFMLNQEGGASQIVRRKQVIWTG